MGRLTARSVASFFLISPSQKYRKNEVLVRDFSKAHAPGWLSLIHSHSLSLSLYIYILDFVSGDLSLTEFKPVWGDARGVSSKTVSYEAFGFFLEKWGKNEACQSALRLYNRSVV